MSSINTVRADSSLEETVLSSLREDEIFKITCELLAIESHRFAPGHETPAAIYLRDLFLKEGIPAELREVRDGRCNVIATLKGEGGRPSLMFNGHTDTVPPGEMPEPFRPHVVDGKLYARGACDMKAGLAAQAYAMIGLKRAGVRLGGDLIFTGVIAEEDSTSLGSLDIIENGPLPGMVVVAEPSDLRVIVAHKGFDYYRIEVEGLSAHSSAPHNGVNAIYAASRIVTDIEERLIKLSQQRSHPLLGSASTNVGAITGYAVNEMGTAMRQGQGEGIKPPGGTVPDVCTIYLDRRRIPGETLELVAAEIDGWLAELHQRYPGLKAKVHLTPACPELPSHPPLDTPTDHPLVREALRAVKEITGIDDGPEGVPFWSDAALFNDGKRIPAIVFGPGHIGQAHSDHEFVPVAELIQATRINAAFAMALLGAKG